jgi:hypothetical protein
MPMLVTSTSVGALKDSPPIRGQDPSRRMVRATPSTTSATEDVGSEGPGLDALDETRQEEASC